LRIVDQYHELIATYAATDVSAFDGIKKALSHLKEKFVDHLMTITFINPI
jgi:hypothetical protein